MIAAPLLALAVAAAAQSPMPFSGEAPAASPAPVAASTAAAVAASTDTLANVVSSTGGVKIAGGVKAKLARPMHAEISADAKNWEPLAVRTGGDPFQAGTKAVVRQEKVRGKFKGAAIKAPSASARLYKTGRDRWLVVRVFPKETIEKRRIHFEVRFKIVEGLVEEAKAAVVTIVDRRPGVGAGLDAYELRARGVEFEEDSPSSGTLLVSALDPRPSKSAVNSGTLKRGSFGNTAVGLADVSWSATGLPPPK